MKIKPEHYAHMRDSIKAFCDANQDKVAFHRESLKADPRVKDIEKRFRWDLSYATPGLSQWICDNLYPYMYDGHLDNALRSIVKEIFQ